MRLDARLQLLFWAACIPIRLVIASAAVAVEVKGVRSAQLAFASIALLMSGGFFVHAVLNKKIGINGGKAWWAPFRTVHAFTYAAYAILTLLQVKGASAILFGDVVIGLGAYLFHHYS